MKIVINFFLFSFCIIQLSFAQKFIEPYTGIQADLTNKKYNFKQLNAGVQFTLRQRSEYELIFQLQKSLPMAVHGADSAFTANPNLPLFTVAPKTIRPSALSIAVGHRFLITGKKKNDALYILLFTGLVFQKISATYTYDKANYTILNPSRTLNKGGIYISAGAGYIHRLKHNRLFCQLTVSSPPIRKNDSYPMAFSFMSALAFNAGYSIFLSKK